MAETPGWQLYCLEIDKAGKRIGKFFSESAYDITCLNPFKRKWAYNARDWTFDVTDLGLERVMKDAIKTGSRVLALYGTGSLHHVTYGLCRLADRLSDEYCYIHIDHHCDAWDDWDSSINHEKHGDTLSCGHFVKHIAFQSNVGRKLENLIFIGSNVRVLMAPYGRWKRHSKGVTERSIRRSGLKTLEKLLDDSAKDAYVTMDLDVMHPSEIITAYDRGTLRKEELLGILDLIKSKKRIISADILGYNTHAGEEEGEYFEYVARSRCKPATEEKSLMLYKALVDFMLKP